MYKFDPMDFETANKNAAEQLRRMYKFDPMDFETNYTRVSRFRRNRV